MHYLLYFGLILIKSNLVLNQKPKWFLKAFIALQF